ncbi:hypothetical protein B0I24_10147 [Aliidiomarina maris]|uniref:Uncharacterized protein n=1 Tax=Aliidiomarina maris TaxID=531312 RepID=A0A327X5S4_9GAMM|nr:hypothetical protein B0I24_10147 [Aliidiomarina maris]
MLLTRLDMNPLGSYFWVYLALNAIELVFVPAQLGEVFVTISTSKGLLNAYSD